MATRIADLRDELASRCGEARLHCPDPGPLADVVLVDATHDSRQVAAGWLFCCVPGETVDGHDYAESAVAAGAAALLVERELAVDVPQIVVDDVRTAMGWAAAILHGHPSSALTVVGVTGTNGKSSVVQLLCDVFTGAGQRADLIGTLKGARTTPESTDLQRLLAQAVKTETKVVAMEVSSHALSLKRVVGTRFSAAIFTNLGRDHLDFHHTVENYFSAKSELFTATYTDCAVINADDPHGQRLLDSADVAELSRCMVYSLENVHDLTFDGSVSRFGWRGFNVDLPLAGAHNVSNALAAATAASELGVSDDIVVAALNATAPVRGRFELVERGQPFHVAVDYAHSPDALEAALMAARQAAGSANVVVVFGCGGDRDAQKRPEMGRIAERGADSVIVTSDNPRSEDPLAIMDAIGSGFDRVADVVFEVDRRAAIGKALTLAEPGDVVLIAGKGHETYQTIGNETFDFDDRQVVEAFLEAAT